MSLIDLTGYFDKLLAQMQTPEARAAMDRAFHATPKEMGEAAVRQAHVCKCCRGMGTLLAATGNGLTTCPRCKGTGKQ